MTTALPPSPETTLAILLGADEWPLYPDFEPSQAFAMAAEGLYAYLGEQFGLPAGNLLNLFNSPRTADEQNQEIGKFLDEHIASHKEIERARDLLFYFVGHGGFVGINNDFFLAIHRVRADNPGASAMRMTDLSYTLMEKARHIRLYLILDCCFAASSFRAFQADPASIALNKIIDPFELKQKGSGNPTKGISLLCSSDHKTPSQSAPDGSCTMFSQALLNALSQGDPWRGRLLSLRDVRDLIKDQLYKLYVGKAPRPALHSPDQSQGDVADVSIFPNKAFAEKVSGKLHPALPLFQPLSTATSSLPPSKASMNMRREKRFCTAPMQDSIT